MRTLLFCFICGTAFSQKLDAEKVRAEYASEFSRVMHQLYRDITEDITNQPYFLGNEFESPDGFRIYGEDCALEFLLDHDNFLAVPKGTKIRLTGEIYLGSNKLYELRVDLVGKGVIRTYMEAGHLDDVFFPENSVRREVMYEEFQIKDDEVKQRLIKKYNITPQILDSILGDLY